MVDYRSYVLVLLMLKCCNSETIIERKLDGDLILASPICNKCSCGKNTKTYLGLSGAEKCIGVTNSGCDFNVTGYLEDIPLITKEMIDTTAFNISNDGNGLCRTGFTPSSMRILLQNDAWESASPLIVKTISVKISLKEATVIFHSIWSGILVKVNIGCKSGNSEYYPARSCVLFKYEGKATYPWSVESINATQIPGTTKTSSKPTETTSTIETTNPLSTAATTKAKSTKSQVTTTPTIPATTTSTAYVSSPTATVVSPIADKISDKSNIGLIAGVIVAVIVVLALVIIVIVCCRKKKRKRKRYATKDAEDVKKDDENIYEKVGNEPRVEFHNTAYGNQISLFENVNEEKTVQEKVPVNYVNADEIEKSIKKSNSNYYNINESQLLSNSISSDESAGDNKTLISRPTSEYDQIWANKDNKEKNDTSNNDINDNGVSHYESVNENNKPNNKPDVLNKQTVIANEPYQQSKPTQNEYDYAQNGPKSLNQDSVTYSSIEDMSIPNNALYSDNNEKQNQYIQLGENMYQLPIEPDKKTMPKYAQSSKSKKK